MNWTKVSDKLPRKHQEVLIWVRYEGDKEFHWNSSWIEDPDNYSYVEPNTGKVWAMGSARGYLITHWMKIEKP